MIQYAETMVSSIQVSSEPLQPLSLLFVERLESRLIALKWKLKKKKKDNWICFVYLSLTFFLLFPDFLSGKSEMPIFQIIISLP